MAVCVFKVFFHGAMDDHSMQGMKEQVCVCVCVCVCACAPAYAASMMVLSMPRCCTDDRLPELVHR